jgi:ABC-2 type transport system ATP-binding protein
MIHVNDQTISENISPGSPPSSEEPWILSTEGLRKSFQKFVAVENLSLHVPQGKIYGFLGRNGAGKTTTIRMLMGIIRADRGSIRLFGNAIHRVDVEQKQSIGYVSQGQFFYPWMSCRTLGSFVAGFYPHWDDTEFLRLLHLFELPLHRKVSALSQGMKVKLALALALSHRPPLLILDEPTSGLDPVARREFLQIIHDQARKYQRTTFFSSHLTEEVERIADYVGIINHGRLCFEGELPHLCESYRWIRIPRDPSRPIPLPIENLLPPHCQVIRQEATPEYLTAILHGATETWNELHISDAQIHPLSLEDIFILITGGTGLEI